LLIEAGGKRADDGSGRHGQRQNEVGKRRRSQYRMADTAALDRDLALRTLAGLEKVLVQRLGLQTDDIAAVRRILAADWGPEISDQQELDTLLER